MYQSLLSVLTAVVFALGLVVPAGAALFGEFTIKEEKELGRKFKVLIHSRFPLVEDPEITSYIRGITKQLIEVLPPQPFDIEVNVIRHSAMNAFASPAGHLYVYSGLILQVERESELAGVIAHELAHVTQRHIAANIERSQLVSLGMLAGMIAGALAGSSEVGQAMMYGSIAGGQSARLKYSREDEREADQVGMNYLIQAGFRPQGMYESFEKIRKLKYLSGGSVPTYLSTHPGVEERIDYLRGRVGKLPDSMQQQQEDNAKLRRIQTILRAKYTDASHALDYFTDDSRENEQCLQLLGQAIVLERTNRVTESAGKFEKALACSPKDPLFQREAGRFHFTMGRFDQAESLLQEAVLRNPGDAMALFYYARLLHGKGRSEEAVTYMKRVLRYIPEQPEVHYHLARILGEQGNRFQAHIHLAYQALYTNDLKKARFHMDEATHEQRSVADDVAMDRITEVYEEREEFLKDTDS